MVKVFSVLSLGEEEMFTIRKGRVCWTGLAATCENCGCEIHNGRRNAESDQSLKKRLNGKVSKVSDGFLPCAGCGREYSVVDTGIEVE